MEDFIVDEKSSFVLLIDANNLYAGVMDKLFLPVEDFGKIHFWNKTSTWARIHQLDSSSSLI